MDDVFDAAWRERFRGRHPAVESELATLIDVHGSSLLDQSAQLRLLLTQACPDAQRQITILLAAISAGVALRLRGASDDADLPAVLQSCAETMQRHGVAEVDWAWWAVRTWAHAFALPVAGGSRPSLPDSAQRRAPFAPWQADAQAAAPAGSPATTARPVAPAPMQPIGTPDTTSIAPRTAAPIEHPIRAANAEAASAPVPIDPVVAETISAPIPIAPVVAESLSAPIPIEPAVVESMSTPIPIEPAVAESMPTPIPIDPLVAPTVPTRSPIEPAVAARREPVLGDTLPLDEPSFAATVARPDADAFAPTAFMPGRAWNESDDRPRRTRRPALIAAAIAVPPVALLGWFAWSRNAAESPPTAALVAQAPTAPPAEAPVPDATIASNTAATPAAAPPAAEATPPVTAPTPDTSKTEAVAPPTAPASPPAPAAVVEWKAVAATPAAPSVAAPPVAASPAVAAPAPKQGAPAPVQAPAVPRPALAKVDAPRAVDVVAACTPATCGTVAETSEVPGPTARYSIVVRTEDGGSLTFTAPYRLQAGTPVRIVAGKVVPAGS